MSLKQRHELLMDFGSSQAQAEDLTPMFLGERHNINLACD